MKKLIALLLCLILSLSLIAFAQAEGEVPQVAGSYYSYGYDVGTMFMNYYIHFYDEIPGLGKVFHAGMCMDQITFDGTYEVIAEDRAYSVAMDRPASEAGTMTEGTAPYTVVFYDFDGNEIDRCAMDAEHIYNDMAAITGVGGGNCALNLDTDPENSKFAAQYAGEPAVPFLSLIDPEDDTATLDLKVNGKYDDLVVLYVEGTYYNHPNGSMWTQAPSIGFTDYVDCPHRPRYCFGHGLSYTSFEYSDLTLDRKETRPFEAVNISLKIKNTGKCAGTEIVQLYIKDVHASMTRPQKELQGFARLALQPGEEKTVCFSLQPSQTAFLDEDMRWKIEKGEFEVQIGSSSEDIRLQDSFAVTENAYLTGKTRAFYALGEIK